MTRFFFLTFVAPVLLISFLAGTATAQDMAAGIPAFNVASGADGGSTYSLSLQILALMTGLTVLPSLVLGMTSFTRIIIVLSILRQAMGTQQTPPNQVLVAIALFLTMFIMAPTFTEINGAVLSPYLDGLMPADTALINGANLMKDFLV
ncbi:MAG TPA: flagellar biosynthetic protein FliP, partial [Gammaproteobacteria bacterium]|nr:flagellar biosynthetic protein FliP [Gammaproteobacteria bacterium]